MTRPNPGFKNLAMVMAISSFAVFLALLFQFKNAIKPLLVLRRLLTG